MGLHAENNICVPVLPTSLSFYLFIYLLLVALEQKWAGTKSPRDTLLFRKVVWHIQYLIIPTKTITLFYTTSVHFYIKVPVAAHPQNYYRTLASFLFSVLLHNYIYNIWAFSKAIWKKLPYYHVLDKRDILAMFTAVCSHDKTCASVRLLSAIKRLYSAS